MKAFILLSIIAVAFAEKHVCGENQRYDQCGTPCPLTCENYANPPKICPEMCVSGCHCEEGYVKANDGRCVRPENCPSSGRFGVCEDNQEHGCGSTCPLTCENLNDPPKICNLMCLFGCHCKQGYVKTKDGSCVLPEECPNRAPTIEANCYQKPNPARCLSYFPTWYYDVESGTCKEYYHSMCPNGNSYLSEEDCLENCKVSRTAPTACLQEKYSGPCMARFIRYYFNKETGQCEKFVYGGCKANSNNFNTKEGCQAVCVDRRHGPNACLEEKVVGPCEALFERYFFNKKTGRCEKFIYGGCRGNANNFNSVEECNAACGA